MKSICFIFSKKDNGLYQSLKDELFYYLFNGYNTVEESQSIETADQVICLLSSNFFEDGVVEEKVKEASDLNKPYIGVSFDEGYNLKVKKMVFANKSRNKIYGWNTKEEKIELCQYLINVLGFEQPLVEVIGRRIDVTISSTKKFTFRVDEGQSYDLSGNTYFSIFLLPGSHTVHILANHFGLKEFTRHIHVDETHNDFDPFQLSIDIDKAIEDKMKQEIQLVVESSFKTMDFRSLYIHLRRLYPNVSQNILTCIALGAILEFYHSKQKK